MKTLESFNDLIGDINLGSFNPLGRLCCKDRRQRTNKGSRNEADLKADCNPPTVWERSLYPRELLWLIKTEMKT